MSLDILYWDNRFPIMFWLRLSLPFFEIFFDTYWYDKVKTEIGIRFGKIIFRKEF